jgi:hypothetical protein
MASIKREIVLGCFAVLCTVLFIIFNPNRYQLFFTDNLMKRMDGLTGKVEIHTASSTFAESMTQYRWITYPQTKFQDK